MREIKLTSYDLQLTVIALIRNDSAVLRDHLDDVKRLLETYADLNKLCEANNDYTLTLTIDD